MILISDAVAARSYLPRPDLLSVRSTSLYVPPGDGVGGSGLPFIAVTSLPLPPRGPTCRYCPDAGAGEPGLRGGLLLMSVFLSSCDRFYSSWLLQSSSLQFARIGIDFKLLTYHIVILSLLDVARAAGHGACLHSVESYLATRYDALPAYPQAGLPSMLPVPVCRPPNGRMAVRSCSRESPARFASKAPVQAGGVHGGAESQGRAEPLGSGAVVTKKCHQLTLH
jgi:hypothetical protein